MIRSRNWRKGSQVTALTPAQARDALTAFERLQSFFQNTGRKSSLLSAVTEFASAAEKLQGPTLNEAVEGYLSNVASVKRKDVSEAVEEFIAAEEPRTKASNGQRAQLSAKYAYNRAIMLRRFANAFPAMRFAIYRKNISTLSSPRNPSPNFPPRAAIITVPPSANFSNHAGAKIICPRHIV